MNERAVPCSTGNLPVRARLSRFVARPARFFRQLLAVGFLLGYASAHADFSGQVISVLDGDTVDVLVEKTSVRVRLAQIDAPEKAQAFGSRSRQALAAMVARQVVVVRTNSTDRYGRILGTLWLGSEDINKAMVGQGMAWAYRAYLQDASLLTLEAAAKTARAGLWVDPQPVPPWEWRLVNKGGQP